MDQLYLVIKQFLDSLFPSAVLTTWGNLNELISIIFTYGILWLAIVKPLIRVFAGKRGK